MSWLSNSLQLAGELLESVDQKASVTFKPRGAEEKKKPKQEDGELKDFRVGSDQAAAFSVAWEIKPVSGGEYEFEMQSPSSAQMPSRSNSSLQLAGPHDADTFSEWSEVDNESNSGIVIDEMPLSSSSSTRSHLPPLPADMQTMRSETLRLRRENSKLRNDLSSVERQLSNSQEQLEVCQEELEALDKECMDKIASLEREIAQLKAEKAGDEGQFVEALAAKDTHALTLQTELSSFKKLLLDQSNEVDRLKNTLAELTSSKEVAWSNAASGEAHLQQRLTSVQTELKDALAQVALLKKENNETKQSMYARQCALEATNAELTNLVAKLEQNASKSSTPTDKALQQTQETLASTKKLLHEESRKSLLQSQEIARLTQDMTALQTLVLQKEQQHNAIVHKLQQQLDEKSKLTLRTATISTRTAAPSTAQPASNDAQMQAMTRRLLEKQEQLDALRSRYTTLEVRFNELKASKDDKNDAMETHMLPTTRPYSGRARLPQHKIPALEAADRIMLTIGRFLRAYPNARLAVLGYLILLHIWAFVILSFHTSHLNDEVHPKSKTP
ncbi:hypothetical protein Ae201684_010074 [Aphanomyces euteiches]|uniref:Golgin-84 n=1 Tax=Aphanomyces euteiches TaxID=100861 RepID=A0A6G0WZL3_9STRA|nr:hypothetical protein Ae201684_010074 [Aphanomyces euteiches]KAH9134106.1 hypothetical protein AeRB84_019999 [Aphanomyces euteiches]